ESWIEYKPNNPLVRTSAMLAPLGASHPIHLWSLYHGSRAVWDVVPGKVGSDGKVLSVDFLPWVNGDYALHFRDQQGLGSAAVFRLDIRPDPLPVVTLERPSGSQSVAANAEISLQVSAEDEFFAVRTIYLEYRRKDSSGTFLDKAPRRVPLYDEASLSW